MSFSNEMIDVLTLVEQTFWETGKVPTHEVICNRLGIRVQTIETYWKNPDFRMALAARGVDFLNNKDDGALTMEQLMVANMLMNVQDRRSVREKLKDESLAAFNVSPQKLNGWMRQPAFQAHLMKRGKTMFENADPIAFRELVKAVEAGDGQMLKLFFEMRGIYNPRTTVDIDVNVVLIKFVEIAARYITDPAMLQAFADEIEALAPGAKEQAAPPAQQAVPIKAFQL